MLSSIFVDTAVKGRQVLEEIGGGESRQGDSRGCLQMTPQEKREYDWYMKKHEGADTTGNSNAEKGREEERSAGGNPREPR